MTIEQKPGEQENQDINGIDVGTGVSLGLMFGAGVGIALDQLSMGMVIGLNFGLVAVLLSERRQHKRNATIALAILLAGLVITLAIWVTS
jgi:F0F1-type ATP synthase assembly protein I